MGSRATLRTQAGEIVYAVFVPRGEKIWILYNHSVNKGLVEDGFDAVGNRLSLSCSRFRQYGAGIPEPEAGQTFTAYDDYYEISGYDLTLDAQWTYVGRVADHRLRIGENGAVVHYADLVEPGARLGLFVDSWTIAKEILWRCRFVGRG